ncbi:MULTISPECIES: DMT family transporter [Virgibacillus]|uniref:Ligand-binding protein SH3 n=1 Tax=Virgibacillus halodenitrificans TaxID=1482 RepID=A0AAC9J1Y0_VIRHA|nr:MULTISPECIES: SMR family transporter [Virgibacillus]AIF44828.1 multidrug resistance protein SMR [Virgibacillus sp. SK37]APC49921.1 ligand-binding protein SH3 [Virgibacillus halodenitrificans]MBD1223555.1 multidrug efflux SMR transporter [Virgibacillus halodenitrificans]MCG1030252.1 multidrug efflux SMR transporter [Virgibacillus halodenitrificans]MCJ0933132.1 SMR family transporter [Virgibacillus halodenitrificans]
MNKSWIYVILTSLFELIWIFGFNVASEWWHWAIILGCISLDLHFLTKACENLPTGTVYAIFAAAGTVGTALMDVYIFNGNLSTPKVLFMVLLVAGVIGLKLADNLPDKGEKEVVN